jgi:hypothetical protein
MVYFTFRLLNQTSLGTFYQNHFLITHNSGNGYLLGYKTVRNGKETKKITGFIMGYS